MTGFINDHVRITLSTLAQKVLNSDRIIFGASANSKMTYGTLINKIIINYDDDFALNENLLKLHNEEESRIVHLQNDTVAILDALNPHYYLEKISNPNISKYIKCLLETFTRLPFIEREKLILKKDIIQHIEIALNTCKKLQLVYNKKTSLITPICIATAKEGTFQYLIGEDDSKRVSFRLSRIEKIRVKGIASPVSEDTKNKLMEDLSEFGATFVTVPNTAIKVRFSPKGLESYKYSVIHRPMHVAEEDGNILVFNCSEMQALFFFFRFAGDVEILEPLSLRNKFRDLYLAGLNNYQR